MHYLAVTEMSVSPSLTDRTTACFATLGVENPRLVAQNSAYRLAATDGWAEAWQYATDNYNINQNPDNGVRTDVITDEMIFEACSLIAGPTKRVDENGEETTRVADATLSPEEGGPILEHG